MPLIACPDCSAQVSDRAPSCLRCGAPIATAAEVASTGAHLVTTQETSKRLKLHLLISGFIFGVGAIWTFSQDSSLGYSGTPVLIMLGGLAWQIHARFRIWWHHK